MLSPMTDDLACTATDPAWAYVRARDQVMRYRRAGRGRPVVLLAPAGDASWRPLAEALGARFRLVVPEAPPAGEALAAWLLDFLEGLGGAPALVVAAGARASRALERALGDAEAVAGVVLAPDPARADEVLAQCEAAAG